MLKKKKGETETAYFRSHSLGYVLVHEGKWHGKDTAWLGGAAGGAGPERPREDSDVEAFVEPSASASALPIDVDVDGSCPGGALGEPVEYNPELE